MRNGFPLGGSCQRPRPLTDEQAGRSCPRQQGPLPAAPDPRPAPNGPRRHTPPAPRCAGTSKAIYDMNADAEYQARVARRAAQTAAQPAAPQAAPQQEDTVMQASAAARSGKSARQGGNKSRRRQWQTAQGRQPQGKGGQAWPERRQEKKKAAQDPAGHRCDLFGRRLYQRRTRGSISLLVCGSSTCWWS